MDQVVQFAKKLDIPVQEFLPETITLNNTNNQHGQGGMILGNIFNNYYSDKETTHQLSLAYQEITLLHEKIAFLEEKLAQLAGSNQKSQLRFIRRTQNRMV